MQEQLPRLFFGKSHEDMDAIKMIIKSGVECEIVGPVSEERTPLLEYNGRSFFGLSGIKEFIGMGIDKDKYRGKQF